MATDPAPQQPAALAPAQDRRAELLAFLALAFGIWPLLAVGIVGGFGFLVWMWQLAFGPPGPPSGLMH